MHSATFRRLLCLCAALARANPLPGSFSMPLYQRHTLHARDEAIIPLNKTFDDITPAQELKFLASSEDTYGDHDDDDGGGDDDNDPEGPVYAGPNATTTTTTTNTAPPPKNKRLRKRQDQSKIQAARAGILGNEKNGDDAYYYISITVGKAPHQTQMYAMIDTGSSTLVLPGVKCGVAEGCIGEDKYGNTGIDAYLQGALGYHDRRVNVEGDMFADDVSIGSLSTQVDIFSISKATNWLGSSQSLGILGLAITPYILGGLVEQQPLINGRRWIYREPSFFERLINYHKLDRPLFAVYLGRTDSNTASKSEIMFGATNPALATGAVRTIPVLDDGRNGWKIMTQDVTVDNIPTSAMSRIPAHIDTGSPWILGPHETVANVWDKVDDAFPVASTQRSSWIFYVYPCDAAPSIAFAFGGASFALNKLDLKAYQISYKGEEINREGSMGSAKYTDVIWRDDKPLEAIQGSDKKWCVARVMSAGVNSKKGTEHWTLGGPFLRNWYSIFTWENRRPTVGFAAVKGNNGGLVGMVPFASSSGSGRGVQTA